MSSLLCSFGNGAFFSNRWRVEGVTWMTENFTPALQYIWTQNNWTWSQTPHICCHALALNRKGKTEAVMRCSECRSFFPSPVFWLVALFGISEAVIGFGEGMKCAFFYNVGVWLWKEKRERRMCRMPPAGQCYKEQRWKSCPFKLFVPCSPFRKSLCF